MLDKVGKFQVQILSVEDTEREAEQSFASTGFCTATVGGTAVSCCLDICGFVSLLPFHKSTDVQAGCYSNAHSCWDLGQKAQHIDQQVCDLPKQQA